MQKLASGWAGFMDRDNARAIYEKIISILGDGNIVVLGAAQSNDFELFEISGAGYRADEWLNGKTGVGFAIITRIGDYVFSFNVGDDGSDPQPPYFRFESNQILVRKLFYQEEENVVFLIFRRDDASA